MHQIRTIRKTAEAEKENQETKVLTQEQTTALQRFP